MRVTTLFSLSMVLFLMGNAQERFISSNYTRYFDWFHEHAQTELLYTHDASLYIFEYETPLREDPCAEGKVIAFLDIGQKVTNIKLNTDYDVLLDDQIMGYDDIWYFVQIQNHLGQKTEGFVWGGHIAKGWRKVDLTGDKVKEFVLLGISSNPRQNPEDIQGEIRILKGHQLLAQEQIPGLCLFEECASSILLRIVTDDFHNGLQIIEASTLTVGCEVSIEKNYFFWDGARLKNIMSGEFAFNPSHRSTPFVLEKKQSVQGKQVAKTCEYSHEDENFNPVWTCREVILQDKKMALPPISKVE